MIALLICFWQIKHSRFLSLTLLALGVSLVEKHKFPLPSLPLPESDSTWRNWWAGQGFLQLLQLTEASHSLQCQIIDVHTAACVIHQLPLHSLLGIFCILLYPRLNWHQRNVRVLTFASGPLTNVLEHAVLTVSPWLRSTRMASLCEWRPLSNPSPGSDYVCKGCICSCRQCAQFQQLKIALLWLHSLW